MVVVVTVAPTCGFLCTVEEEGFTELGLCSCELFEPSVVERFVGYFVSFENRTFSAEVSHSFCCLQSEASSDVTPEPPSHPSTYPTV